MIGLFRRQSAFRRALEAMGLERCSISGADLWIGLPPDQSFRRMPVTVVPESPQSVLFVEGPVQADLISAFVAGLEAATVENLMIGTSHDYISGHRTPYDFAAAMAALMTARMPALKRLIVGDMELLFNGHGYFGQLGDMTAVWDVAPNLETLRICGRAEFSRPMRHETLKTLSLTADDISGHSGPTAPESVNNLLCSHFPRLRELDLSLEVDGAGAYTIPEMFYNGRHMPALSEVSIDGLSVEHSERLERWKLNRQRAT